MSVRKKRDSRRLQLPLKKQPTPQAVIDEHMDALNKCDWNRLMAQYPADYQLNLPDGVVIKGREAAAKIFADFVKPHDQGGLCGIKFSPEQTLVVGETLNIQWKAEADFLAEPVTSQMCFTSIQERRISVNANQDKI